MHLPLPKIVAVIGPTASGKTALGAFLAETFHGEIISADAKQVYRRMDIGTAKEKDLSVPQHLIDIKEPGESVTVAEYQRLAYEAIDHLLKEGILPILVGGSGLYAESVMKGYVFAGPGEKRREPKYEVLSLGIDIEREALKLKAASRLRQRVNEGLVEEVRELLNEGISPEWLDSCGLEYRFFSKYVLGEISLEEAVQLTETATNQYIKRQYTWWRRHHDITWVKNQEEAQELVNEFLKK